MELNERLSSWDAMHRCPCGRWEYVCRRGVGLWQRQVEGKFSYLSADVAACEVREWDLKRSPAESIAAMDAKEWVGIIRNSCFAVEGEALTLLPQNVDETTLIFRDCNLDNRVLPVGVKLEGGCHRRIIQQIDGYEWVCDWGTDAPIEPLDVKAWLMAGLSIDPKDIAAPEGD